MAGNKDLIELITMYLVGGNMKFNSKVDEDKYNQWSKQDIYLAYLSQVRATESVTVALNNANKEIARVKYVIKQV